MSSARLRVDGIGSLYLCIDRQQALAVVLYVSIYSDLPGNGVKYVVRVSGDSPVWIFGGGWMVGRTVGGLSEKLVGSL